MSEDLFIYLSGELFVVLSLRSAGALARFIFVYFPQPMFFLFSCRRVAVGLVTVVCVARPKSRTVCSMPAFLPSISDSNKTLPGHVSRLLEEVTHSPQAFLLTSDVEERVIGEGLPGWKWRKNRTYRVKTSP